MNMRQTVEFDIALALQLRSQNVSLIAVTISGIDTVTWNVIKVVPELFGKCQNRPKITVFDQ